MRLTLTLQALTFTCLSATLSLTAFPALSQEGSGEEAATSRPITAKTMARQVEHMIGDTVEDAEGTAVGPLGNLLVDADGKVAGIVVTCKNDKPGCPDAKKLALPWSDVRLSPDGRKMTLTATLSQLADRPAYDPLRPTGDVAPDALPFPSR